MAKENLPADAPAAEAVPAVATAATPSRAYRLAVLGGGLAGMVAAQEAARRRVRVALVLPVMPAAPLPSSDLAEQLRLLQARLGSLPPQNLPAHPLIDVYSGQPRFLSDHAVEVDDRVVRFRKAVIATGRLPHWPR